MRHGWNIEKVFWAKKGKGISAAGQIPPDEEFFQDHFPGFPVLPGVLAIEMLRQSAELYFEITEPGHRRQLSLKKIKSAKFSHYLKPGDAWQSELELISEEEGKSVWNGRVLHQGRPAMAAAFELTVATIPESALVS
ncbi:MAG: hypothetical protein HYZ85_00145 [Candidatus Omnitrophica bacterium]|nr:hypothetical protein [Candidatus Omnitrophota bacterium]